MKILSKKEVQNILDDLKPKNKPLFEELDKVGVNEGLFIAHEEWPYKSAPANALNSYCTKTGRKFKSIKSQTGYNIIRTE